MPPSLIYAVFDEYGRNFATFTEEKMARSLQSYRPLSYTIIPEILQAEPEIFPLKLEELKRARFK